MIKSNKSICAAYKSTVQTEQAMNFFQVRGAGPFFWQQDYYNTCGTVVLCSTGIFISIRRT